MPDVPYSNEELARMGDEQPTRGNRCPKCGVHIPQFSDLTDEDMTQLQELRKVSPIQAIKSLRNKTGCNLAFAKIWAAHPNGQNERLGPPCPYCSTQLFSEHTRQCLNCGWDWHDENNPRKLTKD